MSRTKVGFKPQGKCGVRFFPHCAYVAAWCNEGSVPHTAVTGPIIERKELTIAYSCLWTLARGNTKTAKQVGQDENNLEEISLFPRHDGKGYS